MEWDFNPAELQIQVSFSRLWLSAAELAMEGVAKAILLAAFNGQKLPYLEIPLYLWCRAFDKMYDWYANDNIFTELTSFIPQHLIHKFNKLRYGHAQNPKTEVGSVGWDK